MTNTNKNPHFHQVTACDKPLCNHDCECRRPKVAEEGGEWEKKLKERGQGVEIEGEHSIRDFPNDPSRLYLDSWLFNFIRTLLSRTRKEAEEKAWRAAVEAVPFDEITRIDLKTDADQRKEGWNSAHQRLITAAKDSGVNLEVCEK